MTLVTASTVFDLNIGVRIERDGDTTRFKIESVEGPNYVGRDWDLFGENDLIDTLVDHYEGRDVRILLSQALSFLNDQAQGLA